MAPSGELIPGDIRVLRELPSPSPLRPLLRKGLADEQLLQLWLPAPRFAVMSSAGVLEVIRRRPIDLLQVRQHPCRYTVLFIVVYVVLDANITFGSLQPPNALRCAHCYYESFQHLI